MKSFDLRLPLWGPYNKQYLGAAHIASPQRGYRFDLNLFPGFYRRSVMTPRDLADCGANMLCSSADASHYIYRYRLQGEDQVYLDADFRADGAVMTVTCRFVNNTDHPESVTLNALCSLQRSTDNHLEILDLQPVVSGETRWVDAVDYKRIQIGQTLAVDGLCLGEKRQSGFTGGTCISRQYFGREDDLLHYEFSPVSTDTVGIRYAGKGQVLLQTNRNTIPVMLEQADEPRLAFFSIPRQEICSLTLLPRDTALDLDGFALGREISFDDGSSWFTPEAESRENGFRLHFGPMTYLVETDFTNVFLRTLHTDDPGQLLSRKIHDHVNREIGDAGHVYADLFLRPIFLQPNSTAVITLRVTAPQGSPTDGTLYLPPCNREGEAFLSSQTIMSAVTLTNVVWPVYSRRGFIRHNTPGRNWDSLYTWDSGFIGMGLAEIDLQRAEDCLNAYMTPVGDPHSPCIFHGSPLPTQILLFAELYNRTGDKELLRRYYPMIWQQHRFFADARYSGRAKETGLFSTWDIFYNSGGWDDYPAQKLIHEQALEKTVCPMVNVSFTVLCARILKLLAGELGLDTAEYEEDIRFYSHAVNLWGWDEASGYYGYVDHRGTPSILQNGGVNADMGMDGAYPFIAGISPADRSRRILQNIREGLFTPIGVSVVDTRAPYFRSDGYWNGSVWMPHQWILWKSLLDHGETETALTIARTALEIWQREVSLTGNCYEHFMLANGRGAGFHQFSGLSTPVLLWFAALYRPWTVTSGFFTVISQKEQGEGRFSFAVRSESTHPTVLVCLEEGGVYHFETSGTVRPVNAGTYAICFDGPVEETVVITRTN